MKKTQLYINAIAHLAESYADDPFKNIERPLWEGNSLHALFTAFTAIPRVNDSPPNSYLTYWSLTNFLKWIDNVQPYDLEDVYNSHELIELFIQQDFDPSLSSFLPIGVIENNCQELLDKPRGEK